MGGVHLTGGTVSNQAREIDPYLRVKEKHSPGEKTVLVTVLEVGY